MRKVLIEMEKLKNLNSGLGQFCLNLGEEFKKANRTNLELDFYLPSSQKDLFGENINYVKHSQLHKIIPINGAQYDVWHCLQQDSHYMPTNKKTKLILTIHDLNFLEKYKGNKQKHKLKSLQKKVNKATAITVISKYTEMIVRENLEINSNTPVNVIYNGNSLIIIKDAVRPMYAAFDNFIFSIGVVSPRKNFHVLLPLLQNNKELHLIIAGDNHSDYAHSITKTAKQMGIEKQLHMPGTITDSDKYWLLKNCNAFVFPSLAEGFGLPVIEAMSIGKPAFLSHLTSLPEVGGTEAYYWKTFEPQSMIDVYENGMKIFNDEKAKREMEWTSQFSWKKAAEAYLNLYETI